MTRDEYLRLLDKAEEIRNRSRHAEYYSDFSQAQYDDEESEMIDNVFGFHLVGSIEEEEEETQELLDDIESILGIKRLRRQAIQENVK